jgi:CRISPR system Cascade subunit CasE
MYLSRLILTPRSRRVRSEVSHVYELHRSLMRAFPAADAGGPGRVLFRVDSPAAGGLVLLAQSEQPPDWSWLAEVPGYLAPGAGDNPAVKPYQPSLSAGQRLAFRLRANPTVKREGKRYGLNREDEQRAWLARKAVEGGFGVLTANVVAEGNAAGHIHRPDGESHALQLLAVRFDGLLQVQNPLRFVETLRQGIGSGKGLGFGLLSIGRP